MNTRTILRLFGLLLLGLLGYQGLMASHDVGAEMRLECINACSTRVHFKVYRDCTGAVGVYGVPAWLGSSPSCTNLPDQVSAIQTVITEATPVCPSVSTGCNNPNAVVRGVEQYAWSILYNTCTVSPCLFDLLYLDCCRNMAITSLNNPSSLSMVIFQRNIDLSTPSCNNSPRYTNIPVLHLCAGQSRTYAMGGTDPDGDSLAYDLTSCWEDTTHTVPYLVGYSSTSPLGPTWGCSVNPVSGLLHLTAQPGNAQVAVVCVTTSEYRNGNFVGSNSRDMQVVVSNCNGNNTSPIISNISVPSGNATVVGNDVYVCAQTPFCLDINASDLDPGQVFQYYWDSSIAGGTFADAFNPSATDTLVSYFGNALTGRFCWTAGNGGTYGLRLSVRDNFCPFPSGADTVIWIHVIPMPFVQATATLVGCLEYDFQGYGGGCGTSGNMSYLWSGGGGIAGTSPSFNHHFPTPGVYPWQLIVDDGQGFRDTIRDTVEAVQTLNWATLLTGITPLDACLGPTSCVLDAGPGYVQYDWSTGATAQSITVGTGGNYAVTVEETTGCLLRDAQVITATPADLSGIVTNHAGLPMASQRVRLLRLQPSPLALLTIDSTLTDAQGYYQFCDIVDTTVYAKVHPNISTFPLDMPTYADTALVWNLAHAASPLLNGPTVRNIHTIYGQNPGGSASIGGTVVQGSNKVDSLGDPVPGLRLFLRHVGLGQIVGYRDTDVNGYFIFSSLPFGDYEVIPDFPYVDEQLPPLVTLNAEHQHRDALDFRLHPTWLELVIAIGIEDPLEHAFALAASPNPCTGPLELVMELQRASRVQVQLHDLTGRQLIAPIMRQYPTGRHQLALDLSAFASGVYFLHVQVDGRMQVLRIVKG